MRKPIGITVPYRKVGCVQHDCEKCKQGWVGLTDDELNMLGDKMKTWNSTSLKDIYIAIESKLNERNT